jgi:signal transduction histidine kinase
MFVRRSRNRPGIARIRSWFVLLIGFGGLLALLITAGANALVSLDHLRSREASTRRTFLTRNGDLEQIRSALYLSGTYIRDYLLAPEPPAAEPQKRLIESLRSDTDRVLERYGRQIDPAEAPAFDDLRTEIESYWKVVESTYTWSPAERSRLRYRFYYEELFPRRTAMLQVAEKVAKLNDRALARGQEQLTDLYDQFRRQLFVAFLFTTVGGLLLAGIGLYLMLRLENEAERQFAETAQARADLEELSARLVRTQEDERRAISRELHDEVGQSLSAILMETGNALGADEPGEIRNRLESINALASKSLDVIRNIALLLRPSMLDDFGLIPALRWQAREVAKRSGLRIEVLANELDDLPEEHNTCIYRIVQEALNNCARHARARHATIHVAKENGMLVVTVEDDGAGFATGETRGLGLIGMEERVRRLGGVLSIASRLGQGTIVRAEFPLTFAAAWV